MLDAPTLETKGEVEKSQVGLCSRGGDAGIVRLGDGRGCGVERLEGCARLDGSGLTSAEGDGEGVGETGRDVGKGSDATGSDAEEETANDVAVGDGKDVGDITNRL